METIFQNSLLMLSGTAAFRQIGDEMVIVDTRHNKMMTLNETGSKIWSQLAKTESTIHEIACTLQTDYRIDLETAIADTVEFLSELHARGLVQKKE